MKDLKFAILGRIIYSDHFIKELHRNGFPKPVVIVSPDEGYLRDRRLLEPFGLWGDLEALEEQGLCELYKYKNVNTDEVLNLLKEKQCNIGFSINCRNIVKSDIINFFNRNIFNIHDSYLPNERGGALNSWRILNGINSVGNTIHYLEEGIDSGPIVLRQMVDIEKLNPRPVDYLKTEVENCEQLLTQFVEILVRGDKIPNLVQNNDRSLYFPRLYTELNGAINWDWKVEKVEMFIRAFSTPYPGAYTYYRGKKSIYWRPMWKRIWIESFIPFVMVKL